jgi:glycosyltransferase involved in cell wall biosynthesis
VISPKASLTVGMPVYNGERFIQGAISSILSQTYEDFRLVISDNASIDRTEEICRCYADEDRRIQYMRSPENRGAAWNHNRLVEVAEGRFFKWIGADDLYHPEFLARCVEELEKNPAAVLAYPRSVAIDEAGNHLYQYTPGWNLQSDSSYHRLRGVILNGGHWINADAVSGVIRLDSLRKTRLLPKYQGGDKRPLGELSLVGKFVEIPEYFLFRRFHPNSSGRNNPYISKYERSSVQWMTEFFKGSTWSTCLPSWTLIWDHAKTIWSSSLPLTEKIGLTTVCARTFHWYKPYFVEELKALRHVVPGPWQRDEIRLT